MGWTLVFDFSSIEPSPSSRQPTMRAFSKPKHPAPDKPAPTTANADTTSDTGPPSDFRWHESSYELARGLDAIECEWPDTTSGVYSLD